MLEETKKELPEELSKRFDLNRFFAFQRDIINDELQSIVPDLVEDALENPTGSYQRVSKFQNEKLMDIDRTTIAIKEMLTGIQGQMTTLGSASGGGGLFGGFGDILKTWLEWKLLGRAFGKGGKPTIPETKTNAPDAPKKRKTKGGDGGLPTGSKKPAASAGEKIKDFGANLKKTTSRLKTTAKWVMYLGMADISYKVLTGQINSLDDLEEEGKLLAKQASYSVADNMLTQHFYNKDLASRKAAATEAAEAAKKSAPTAKPDRLLRRHELDPTHPLYIEKGTKVPKGAPKPTSFVTKEISQEQLAKRAAKTEATYLSKAFGMMDDFGSGLKNFASETYSYGKASLKSTAIVTAAFALWDFYDGITSLPPGLTEDQYTEEIAKLSVITIGKAGIVAFGGFVGDLVGTAGGAAIGSGAAPVLGTAIGGIIGNAVGLIGGIAGGLAADALYGEDVVKIANSPEVKKYVKMLVRWVMDGIKTVKQSVKTASQLKDIAVWSLAGAKSTENNNDAASRQRTRMKYAAGSYALAQDKKKSPMQKRLEAVRRPQRQQTEEQATQVASEDPANTNPYEDGGLFSSTGIMGNVLKGLGVKGADIGAITGTGAALEGVLKKAYGEIGGLSAVDMMGGSAGAMKFANMLGLTGPITNDMAATMGLVDKGEDASGVTKAFNSIFTPDANRTVKAQAMANPIESMTAQMSQQFASLQDSLTSRDTVVAPSIALNGFPSARSTPPPTALGVVALRGQGMADVYSHHQGGATMERMDRGGETLFG